jgi:hypothetical protein
MQRDSGDVQDHGNIKVVTRIRPINHVERSMGRDECINVEERGNGYAVKVLQEVPRSSQYQCESPRTSYITKEFPFDSCVAAEEDQAAVFEKCGVKDLLDSAFEGTNVTVFAYGQTGSGKTYTIHGMQGMQDPKPCDGIIPRALDYIFDKISSECHEITFGVSYCEIYNETVNDLLLMRNTPLKLKWDSGEGFHAPDIHIQPCNTLQDAYAVLDFGNKRRKQRSHLLNAESSRSHAILTMYLHLESPPRKARISSKINFVDLAGSERLKESGSGDEISIKETANINKSLFLLGNVICALASGQPRHLVPYRESKLTKLLFGSMTRPSKCVMIACCSPRYDFHSVCSFMGMILDIVRKMSDCPHMPLCSENNVEESLTTLKYATRFSKSSFIPSLRVDHSEMLVASLKRENRLLKQEIRLLRDIANHPGQKK